MIDGLYNTDVLSLAANISHVGRLGKPCGTARKVSKLCGSWVEVDVCERGGMVTNFAVRLQACALGQACAAILAQAVMGASKEELQAARDGLYAMLKQGGEPPQGRFAKLALLKDVANYPARHTSTMLAFDAVLAALKDAKS
ncbi:MAG: iron-sulfur cluster assembly scaffold protein [Robiginitomaculum sp.]|nr:iron-sulfur cluster assembly scaffold protein [Robiginitomaculum sp.]